MLACSRAVGRGGGSGALVRWRLRKLRRYAATGVGAAIAVCRLHQLLCSAFTCSRQCCLHTVLLLHEAQLVHSAATATAHVRVAI